MIIDIVSTEFEELLKTDKLLLLDFYAEWCAPCQRLLKILPRLDREDIIIGKINVDTERAIADSHNITQIPTFIVYKNSIIVESWTGIKTLLEINRIIETHK